MGLLDPPEPPDTTVYPVIWPDALVVAVMSTPVHPPPVTVRVMVENAGNKAGRARAADESDGGQGRVARSALARRNHDAEDVVRVDDRIGARPAAAAGIAEDDANRSG